MPIVAHTSYIMKYLTKLECFKHKEETKNNTINIVLPYLEDSLIYSILVNACIVQNSN